MKLKRLISCGLVGILTGVGILMNAKVSSAEDKSVGVLTFPDENKNNNKVGAYTKTWNAKMNGREYTISNFNNNNWGWKFIRCGSKKAASIGKISTSSYTEKIGKIVMTIDSITSSSVNSIKLNVIDSTSVIEKIDGTKEKGECEFKITNPGENLTYEIEVDCAGTSKSNGFVQVSKVEYFLESMKYNVSFFDGTEEYTEYAKKVEANGKLERPVDPPKEGYVFVGWYTEPELINVYNFDSPVTADLKLYAKFEEAASVTTHTVTFKSDSETTYDTSVVKEGNSVVKPENPIKEGYVFDGWYTDANCTNENAYDFNTPVNTDITLYAKWLAKYTVSFDTDGGSTVESQTVITGNKATKPAVNPTKKGYNFKGWYKDSAHSNEFDFENDTITDNTTIYARFDEPELLSVSEAQQLAKQFVGKNSPDLYKVKGKVSSISNENQKITIVLREGSSEFTFYQVEKTETVKVGDIVVGVGYLYYYKSGITSEFNQKCTYTVLKGVDLFEQLEIKNQLAYHWQTEDGTTYTIDNVSLRFGVNLTEEMKSLEGVKFGAILAKKVDVANINLSEYARECTSAAEVVAGDPNLKYLEFTNIAAEGGMTSLRLDNLDSAIAEEFVVVIYMEYNGKLYVTEQKIASVKVIASEYLKSDLEILKNEQIKGSLNQLSK